VHEADVGAEGDLDAAAEGVAVDGVLGLSSVGAGGSAAPTRSPLAIALNEEKSRPAQNDAPSPDSTTTRTFGMPLSASPASRRPVNIAVSSALRFSGRFMRTSATPCSSTLMVTRSLIATSLPAMLGAMKLNLTADEVLTTTRSVRKRLDFDKPVDRAVVEECLEIALQAPTGSNRQGWHWVVIEDPELKAGVADIYRKNFEMYRSMPAADYPEGDSRAERQDKVRDSAGYLSDNFHRAPLLLIPCIWGRLDNASVVQGAGAWGSLLPAVWSFMLALRERGMGSAWTTIHLMNDGERQVAELLGIPYDKVSQAGLFPIAYTIGTEFKLAKREPLDSILHWDRW
jgi:nitroreductase